MAHIHIERTHHLGMIDARRLADRWSDEAAKRFDLVFSVQRGDHRDTHEFARTGVRGSLLVDADRFTIDARLGVVLRAFSGKIESEIKRNLDALLQATDREPTTGGDLA